MVEDPIALRKIYFDAWQKNQQHLPLSPLETMIVDIIQRHPEYHPLFTDEHFEEFKAEKYALDHNPFFHLGLHVTIAEQVSADRPQGIQAIFQALLKKHQNKTMVEHKMMECLARVLIESFAKNSASDESQYLEALRQLK
ncbi:MAG: DUF1841 family protein [Proteobacteria bacterium]|nr:DUF1841 family protein [Pseudomonadota bacterium]